MKRYSTPYTLQKRLKIVNLKLKRLERNSNFFKKNIFKVVLFGIVVCLIGPYYSVSDDLHITKRKSVLEQMDDNYLNSVLLFVGVYTSLCLLGHIVWNFQDKKTMNKLLKEKKSIEEKIKDSNHVI